MPDDDDNGVHILLVGWDEAKDDYVAKDPATCQDPTALMDQLLAAGRDAMKDLVDMLLELKPKDEETTDLDFLVNIMLRVSDVPDIVKDNLLAIAVVLLHERGVV